MPCTYDNYLPLPGDRQYTYVPADDEVSIKKTELDRLTRVACSFAKSIESIYKQNAGKNSHLGDALLDEVITQECYDWYVEHLKADKAREEKLKEAALSKLTDEEKKVLGLI